MNKKILVFVFDGKEFLILHSKPHPKHGNGGWFTITGSVEAGESSIDAVKREIKEETNLKTPEILDLKWGSRYSWGGEDNLENNFFALVKRDKIVLNEEHDDFEWIGLEEFIKKINWDSDKEELKNVLQRAIKRELFFKKEKII